MKSMHTRTSRIGVALIAIATLVAPAIAPAQGPPPPPLPTGGDIGYFAIQGGPGLGMPDDAVAIVGFEGGVGGKTVTGAPFTATFSTQTSQTLADGNQIRRSTTGSFARDSQGRTRRDVTLPGIGPWAASDQPAPHVVMINDVVANTQYILNPNKKIAHQVRPPQFKGRHARRDDFGPGGPPPDDGGPVVLGERDRDKDVVTTSLGTQTINGVLAEGTRYTRTIPAGAIGNQNPIVITSERWYSPDLQVVVLSKRNDPRAGETITQLTNIQRGEPDASLFQVPSDYTLKQGGPQIAIRTRGRLDQ